jgi:hypothetical protein
MTQEALKLALEALETPSPMGQYKAITAIKEALAQPEQEPVKMVAYNCFCGRTMKFESVHGVVAPQRTEQEPVAHWSDCAVHSEPAYPKGECDCGGIVAVADYTALSDKYVALSDKYVALKAQRTWVDLTDEEIAQGCKESWVTEQAFQSAVWWAEAKLKEKNCA